MSTSPNHKSNPSSTPVAAHRPIKYVVVRGGHRVSDKEYDTPSDPRCLDEIKFWSKVSSVEKVEAVLYDSKRHRVW